MHNGCRQSCWDKKSDLILQNLRSSSHLGQNGKTLEDGAILKEAEPKAHLWTEHHIKVSLKSFKSNSEFLVGLDTLDFSKQIWVHICDTNCILFLPSYTILLSYTISPPTILLLHHPRLMLFPHAIIAYCSLFFDKSLLGEEVFFYAFTSS